MHNCHHCFLYLFGFVALLCGCSPGGIPTNLVEGTIRWNDQPVAGAVVTFVPAGGGEEVHSAFGTTDEQGNYLVTASFASAEFESGAVAGPYKVTVTKIPSGAPGRPSRTTQLPGIYAEVGTTPLTADVVAGKNRFDFTLEGAAPPPVRFTPPPSGQPPQPR